MAFSILIPPQEFGTMQTLEDHPLAEIPIQSFDERAVERELQRLPKIDLHRHLEGAISPAMLLELANIYAIELPATSVETLRPFVEVTAADSSLKDFLAKFDTIGTVFVSYAACEDIAYRVVERAAADNIVYLELRFSPLYMASAHCLDPVLVTQSVIAGMQRASYDYNISCNGILIVERQLSLESAQRVVDIALQHRMNGIVAIDLANDEASFPPGPFAALFSAARQAGLHITVHAGEAAGPENILTAVQHLHAERIGHGVRLCTDPAIEHYILESQIPLELCLTSNIQTGAVIGYDAFPLRHYLDMGIRVTLNTDDPGISAVTLSGEIFRACKQANLTVGELSSLLLASADAAFTVELERQFLRDVVTEGVLKFATILDGLQR